MQGRPSSSNRYCVFKKLITDYAFILFVNLSSSSMSYIKHFSEFHILFNQSTGKPQVKVSSHVFNYNALYIYIYIKMLSYIFITELKYRSIKTQNLVSQPTI